MLLFSLTSHRSDWRKVWWLSHVHVRTTDFVFRNGLCGESVPVSTQIDYSLCDAFASGAVRSFFGGFSSTAGYVPGNEAFPSRRTSKRRSTLWDDHFPRALSVFIRTTRFPLRFRLASLSASTPSVLDSGIPLLLSSNGVSPPPFHLLVPVKLPVSNLDCETILHPKKSMSSRKYFN